MRRRHRAQRCEQGLKRNARTRLGIKSNLRGAVLVQSNDSQPGGENGVYMSLLLSFNDETLPAAAAKPDGAPLA